jgi:Mce-associated membrane protein
MTVEVEDRADAAADADEVKVQRLGTGPADDAVLRRWRRAALAAGALAIVAGVALGWQSGRTDPTPTHAAATAAARDQVLIAASEAVETLNTLDHRDVAGGLETWESVTTGELGDQIAGIQADQAAALAEAGAVSTARVVEAAVVDLDAAAGAAEVIAFVEVTIQPGSGRASVDRHQYSVEMRRVDGRWLVAALTAMGSEQ